jgi:hypothetical protein
MRRSATGPGPWPFHCQFNLTRPVIRGCFAFGDPRGRGADRRAGPYSITSSARASSDCGTVRPSALAVFMLRANT